jgi:hypothetical protein
MDGIYGICAIVIFGVGADVITGEHDPAPTEDYRGSNVMKKE